MEKKRRVSMKTLAQELGVSVPTISRALNNSREIGAELRARIQQLAKERDYRPNPFAQSLRKGAPKLIGVVVPDFTTHFHSSVISGIESVASDQGYGVICCNSHECAEDEKQCLESLKSLHVEGIIACLAQDTTDYAVYEALHEGNIPLVFFARTCRTDLFSSVVSDGITGARESTQHLIDQGCKRIAFIGGPNHLDMTKRRKHGYIEALHDAGLSTDPALVRCGELTVEAAYDSAKQLLLQENRPDAILAANDKLLYGVLKAVKELDIKIPDDLAVIAFTDNPDVEYITPAVSAISDHATTMGRTACRLLLEQIMTTTPVRQEVLPMKLILRESSKR